MVMNLIAEGEICLDSIKLDDDHWPHCVQWARDHPHRVKATNELPEAERPRPCPTHSARDQFSAMIHSKCHYIPSKSVEHLVRIFGGADLIRALVSDDIRTVSLPETKCTALIIPVPDLERFNKKPPFESHCPHLGFGAPHNGHWCHIDLD